MVGSNNYGHQHPLLLILNEDQQLNVAKCSRCREKVSTPCFSCAQDCGFYLHKVCAEAPLELNHPFHSDHPLLLMQNPPYPSGGYYCNFCGKYGNEFVYHCSCDFDFHIKCALFTFNIAENNLKELEHVSLQDEELEDDSKCFGCWEPLAKYTHFSPDCGFNLHDKCAELPFKLNLECHREHPLVLQFNSQRLSCKICRKSNQQALGFFYGCSPCEFVVHIECASQSPLQVIKSTSHEHPFTLFNGHQHPLFLMLNQEQLMDNQRGVTDCSRCGEKASAPCFCCAEHCGFYLHKVCAEAPLELNHPFHLNHPLLMQNAPYSSGMYICNFCNKSGHKSVYRCSSCELDFHIKCALFTFNIAENNLKELEHVALQDEELEDDNKCFGCQEPLTNYTHFSPDCGFNLHEKCAELPFKLNHGCHRKHPLVLQFNSQRLSCKICRVTRRSTESGFFYGCSPCKFVVHIECASQSPLQVIKSTNYEHPFTLFNGHQYPLLLMLNQEQLIDNQGGVTDCSRCGEKVSAPCFYCAEHCGFYLHKVCAEAPLELHHPFHLNHPLLLMQKSPHLSGAYFCTFCHEFGDKSVYHCSSCELDFHIKCALFTLNIAENNLKELEHVALHDPLISTENGDKKLKDVSKCFGCWEPLAMYTHFSPDCGFNLHEKCAELPFKLNHVYHRKHPLVLQFNSKRLSCKICQVPRRRGFVYGCSPCKFVVHIECASQSSLQVIKNTNHEHPFTLFLRQVPFTCDACGTEGNHVSYTCGTCNIIIHKNCISLPRIIKSKWHDHPLIHTYFHHIEDFRVLDCLICHDEVNTEHGSYYCSKCDVIFHVKCAMKDKDSYEIVENEDEMPHESSISVIERNDAGEATKIKHFKHMHNLMLGPFVGGYENSCNGCMLPISDPFYYCSECVFFLHKACAELTKMKNVWHHHCQEPLALISDKAFECQECWHISNAFAYECSGCEENKCLRCVIVLTPGARTCLKHVHPLYFYRDYEGQCNACGDTTRGYGAFCCKDWNFVLDLGCFSLPITARHKCDEHLLSLTDNDGNSYSESHHCDICEESRDPNRWFYHCTTCDTSAHVGCVLGSYPFLKLGSIYEETNHPHPLIIVKKKYYYLDCNKCGKPCEDVALECSKLECKYIVHWDCVAPYFLRQWWKWGM